MFRFVKGRSQCLSAHYYGSFVSAIRTAYSKPHAPLPFTWLFACLTTCLDQVVADLPIPGALGVFTVFEGDGHHQQDSLVLVSASPPVLGSPAAEAG